MKIKLDIFEGPLDLLLYLIKKNHINIYDIPIVSVVEQYLQFLEFMKFADINVASEYLAMAANLISIKSKMLLPQEQIQEEEQQIDPREELVKRLLEYQKFKEAADFLKTKELERFKYVRRVSTFEFKDEIYFEASIFDLISAFKNALKEVPKDIFFEIVKDEFTIEEKIHDILHTLLFKEKISLDELFKNSKNKIEIIVIFLAILELIKLKEVICIQERPFGEVLIVRREDVFLKT